MKTPQSFVFTVSRSEPELIPPATQTPYELKMLSDIDDQKGHRVHSPFIKFYKNSHTGMQLRDDVVRVIRDAIAKTLVFYYPFAGRLKERSEHKLMVECNGKGIMFVEADANVSLDELGRDFHLRPPFPGAEGLLYDVPGSDGILDCPLLLIQVTRMRCGGFVFGIRVNHLMADATGLAQFMVGLGEIARGASVPSIQPVWLRELLNASDPPHVSCCHHIYRPLQETHEAVDDRSQWCRGSIFFGVQEMERLRSQVSTADLVQCSKFDIITACIWKCRTRAFYHDQPNSKEAVRVAINVDRRSKCNPPLPVGYYGNAVVLSVAASTAGQLSEKPLGYALELVKRAKASVTSEFMRLTRIGLEGADFGWGKAAYCFPLWGNPFVSVFTSTTTYSTGTAQDGILVKISLPPLVMERFTLEIQTLLKPIIRSSF